MAKGWFRHIDEILFMRCQFNGHTYVALYQIMRGDISSIISWYVAYLQEVKKHGAPSVELSISTDYFEWWRRCTKHGWTDGVIMLTKVIWCVLILEISILNLMSNNMRTIIDNWSQTIVKYTVITRNNMITGETIGLQINWLWIIENDTITCKQMIT